MNLNLITNWLIILHYNCYNSCLVTKSDVYYPLDIIVALEVDRQKLPSKRRAAICFYKLPGMCSALQTSARLAYEIPVLIPHSTLFKFVGGLMNSSDQITLLWKKKEK